MFVIAGGLFYKDLNDARADAKDQAARIATEASRDAVKKAFEEEHVKKLVEDVAKEKISAVTDQMVAEKVGPIADKMIEQRLTSKLQPIEESIVQIGRVSECEARIHLGYRSSLFELMSIVHDARDHYVREFAKATLTSTTKNYEDFWITSVKDAGTNSAVGLFSDHLVKPGKPLTRSAASLVTVVDAIDHDDDLNTVTLAFLCFRELTGEQVKMFDFDAVKVWCGNHKNRCQS